MPQIADRVKETTTTTGTGALTLAGAAAGFQTFSAAFPSGGSVYYAITDGTNWEVGTGTYTVSGTTLARTTILASSNANAAVSWGAGSKTVFCTAPAAMLNTTQPLDDNSTNIATTAFVQGLSALTMATVPLAGITGGTYSFASLGSGCTLTYTVTTGAISGITAVAAAGSGFAVGDLIYPKAGNKDAVLQVATISGSGVATLNILYGGTGYANASAVPANPLISIHYKYRLSGTLTSNATFILTSGTYLTQSNQWIVANNTTGAFTTTFKVAGQGVDSATGTGVVIPQGTSNSLNTAIESDGVTDVWLMNTVLNGMTAPAASGALGYREIPSNAQSANYTTVLADCGKAIIHPASDANARTFTIDSHANVVWPDGATITFINRTSQVVSIAITTDTMTLAGGTTTGTRSLAQNGEATARYTLATNDWLIAGIGLT